MSAVTGSTGDRRRGRRHVLDQTYERHDAVIIGGSPLRLLRLSSAGRVAATQLERAIAEGEPSPAGPLTARLVDIGAIHPVAEEPARTFGLDDVTVVIPVRRRGREATSQQPAGMTGAPVVPERVIVVDDGSDPPLGWATMRSAQSAGPADARNRGLAAVSTALVAFVDDDVEIDIGDWISPLLGHFDDDAGVVAAAPTVFVEAPDEIDIFAGAQFGIESTDVAQCIGTAQERCCRDVRHPGTGPDTGWSVAEIER